MALYSIIVNVLSPLAPKITQFEKWRKEIMLKYQANSCCGIMSLILVTSLFYK